MFRICPFHLLWVFGLALGLPCGLEAQTPQKPADGAKRGDFRVQPPPFMDGLFPCTGCHNGKTVTTNPKRRVLEDMHENIVLNHLGEKRWCLDCHDPQERDHLRLANGDRVEFTVSYLLCGQCHGAKLREWQAGRHGRNPKSAQGEEPFLLCVHCHNPHSPRIKSANLKPDHAK